MATPLLTIETPNYIRQVKMSDKRRATYYERGKKKLPKKYQDTSKYDYKPFAIGTKEGKKFKYFLVNLITNEKVVANSKSVGTPKYYTINGQHLYDGSQKEHYRNKIKRAIKDFFTPFLKGIKIEQFPIRIFCDIHDLVRDPLNANQLWDVDNRFLGWYVKCFQDTMKDCGCIPDDNVLYITTPPAPTFVPISDVSERKLVFRIYVDRRECIINSKEYAKG